jgi:hypothetical protein
MLRRATVISTGTSSLVKTWLLIPKLMPGLNEGLTYGVLFRSTRALNDLLFRMNELQRRTMQALMLFRV